MYSFIFRVFFARLDPETAHHLAFFFIRLLGFFRRIVPGVKKYPNLQVKTMGLVFDTPFGLAAGFDKDAKAVLGLSTLGFGHVEIGTITPLAQPGNERPRLFRLIQDQALINRMGFNNSGAKAANARLEKLAKKRNRPIIGVNIGKNKDTAANDAVSDYVKSASILAGHADYMVINVSSPNTPGLRGLQELEMLGPIVAAVKSVVQDLPLLVKIAPDMSDEHILKIVELVERLKIAGIIATNTTISREGLLTDAQAVAEIGAGGLSGQPLKERSLAVLRLITANCSKELCVISVGGVKDARDVKERLEAGASLVQGYSAFIYQGPAWARKINRELAQII